MNLFKQKKNIKKETASILNHLKQKVSDIRSFEINDKLNIIAGTKAATIFYGLLLGKERELEKM